MTGRAQVQTTVGVAAIAIATMFVHVAPAQTIPEGQSCGGLVCDLGIIGHKTEPVSPTPPQPAVAPAVKPLAETAPVEKPRAPHPRKRVATKPAARPPAVASRPASAPAALAPVAPAPAPVAAARPVQTPPATPAVAARAPAPAPVYQRPLIFQSIDPTLQ